MTSQTLKPNQGTVNSQVEFILLGFNPLFGDASFKITTAKILSLIKKTCFKIADDIESGKMKPESATISQGEHFFYDPIVIAKFIRQYLEEELK